MELLKTPIVIILVLLLFSSLCCGLAVTKTPELSKYQYVFDPPQRNGWAIVKDFLPTCQAVDKSEIMLASTAAAEYSQSKATAKSAMDKMTGINSIVEQALWTVRDFVRWIYSEDINIAGDTFTNILSSFARPCNSEAFESIGLVLRSDSQAWEKLSQKAEAFRMAYGNSGPAGKCEGVRLKLSQIASDFDNNAINSESLAGRALKLQKKAQQEATDGNLLNPRDAKTVLVDGASQDSVLSGIFSFDDEITSALIELDTAYEKQKQRTLLWSERADAAKKKFDSENLAGIDLLSVFARIPSNFHGTTAKVGNYRQTKTQAEAAIERAAESTKQAQAIFKAMLFGYESDSIAQYYSAETDYRTTCELLESKIDEADALRSALDEEISKKRASIQEQIEKLKETDAAKAAELEKILAELEGVYKNAQDKGAYERLFAALKLLDGIDSIRTALEDSTQDPLLAVVKAEYADFSGVLENAKKDEIAVDFEKVEGQEIKAALSLAETEKTSTLSTTQLSYMRKRIQILTLSILSKADSKYSNLPRQYDEAIALNEAFGQSDFEKLSEYSAFFFQGKLLTEQAIGRLKEMTDFFLHTTQEAKYNFGTKVQKALQDGLVEIPLKQEAAKAGQKTTFSRRFYTKNPFGIGYSASIDIDLCEKLAGELKLSFEGYSLYEKSNRLIARLPSVAAYGEYYFDIRYETVAATIVSESTTTDFIDSSGVRIKKTITFESEIEGPILLSIAVPEESTTYPAASGQKISQQNGQATFLVQAKEGVQEFTIVICSYKTPFGLTQTILSSVGTKITVEAKYKNSFGDIDSPTIIYTQNLCPVAREITVETTDFSYGHIGNDVQLAVAGKWPQGVEKKAVMAIECDNASFTVSQQAALLMQAGLFGTQSQSTILDAVLQKRQEFKKIESSASNLAEYDAVLKITKQADAIAQTATGLLDAASVSKVLAQADTKLSELESLAKYRFNTLYKQCDDSATCKRPLEEARALIDAADWPAAFEKLSAAQATMDQKQEVTNAELSKKSTDYETYLSQTVPKALTALAEFDQATAIAAKQQTSFFTRLKGEGYDHAAALKVRDSLQKAIEKIKENYVPGSKLFNMSSPADLSAAYANIGLLSGQLQSYTKKLEDVTTTQVDLARQSASKLEEGSDGVFSLERAENDAANGSYMSAYAIAKQLQQDAAKSPGTSKAGIAFDINAYLPYIIAVVVLSGLAFAYLKKEEAKEAVDSLEKPPEDYAN